MAKIAHLPLCNFTLLRVLMAISFAVGITNYAVGRQLTPNEALSRLKDSSMSKASNLNIGFDSQFQLMRSISLDKSEQPGVYLFSQNHNRVIVVSANDCAPALLGYFDNSDANLSATDELPDNLEYWLHEYVAQIQYAEENPGTMEEVSFDSSKPAIDFLVKTKWNQDEPYNLLCPEFNGYHCVTGCVATAFAQVMNYHQWPERGRGSHSYSVNYSDVGLRDYSIDFSELEFDWEAMLNEYDDNSDQRSKDAVATLMKACGYSVDMQYTTYSSGAVTQKIVSASHDYFDYSANSYYAERNNYTSQQWANLVYDQLSKGLPLIYSGRDGVWLNSSGHCFVCDGYDGDGFFHFNWGWGGYCDGWFLLSALTPGGVGIGGSSSGYNVNQACIVNFYPSPKDIEATTGYLGADLGFNQENTQIYTQVIPENPSLANPLMSFAIEFSSKNFGKTFLLELGNVPLDGDNIYRPQHSFSYEELTSIGMTDGSYDASFVYNSNGEWSHLLYDTNKPSAVNVTLTGNEIILSEPEKICPVKASDVKFNGSYTIIKGLDNELSYVATNDSDEPIYWVSRHYLVPVGQSPNTVSKSIFNTNLVLGPNETRLVSLPIPKDNIGSLDNGEYYVAIEAGPQFSSTTYVYSDQSVIFNITDTSEALSDGIFVYQDLGNGSLAIIGTADAGVKIGGDVILPEITRINGTQYQVTEIICSISDLIDINNLTGLDIRTPITEIPDYLCFWAPHLKSISFPSTIQTIGKYAFSGCYEISGELILPESLSSIGDGSFYG